MKGRVKERRQEKAIFILWFTLEVAKPRLKPGPRNYFLASHLSGSTHVQDPHLLLPRCISRELLGSRVARTPISTLIWDTGIPNRLVNSTKSQCQSRLVSFLASVDSVFHVESLTLSYTLSCKVLRIQILMGHSENSLPQ